jgi:hypothetical protein
VPTRPHLLRENFGGILWTGASRGWARVGRALRA